MKKLYFALKGAPIFGGAMMSYSPFNPLEYKQVGEVEIDRYTEAQANQSLFELAYKKQMDEGMYPDAPLAEITSCRTDEGGSQTHEVYVKRSIIRERKYISAELMLPVFVELFEKTMGVVLEKTPEYIQQFVELFEKTMGVVLEKTPENIQQFVELFEKFEKTMGVVLEKTPDYIQRAEKLKKSLERKIRPM